ncbi:MAG: NifB/NifX family molybdenum-iron cluster-binding protein [Terrisporobacter othiniensis]|nr:NifB/NifX family molybdenum-iron cluster-binding protein [Terrisporobacter othiniensis]MDU6996787.1 NifB/NifX family molybdenum-iron cluster-binding protein [Terrisporobacter othiniensis]
MKIAISTNGTTKESLLDSRFGRCNYFQIYDTDTKEFSVIENKGFTAAGGAGIAASNQIVDEKVQVVITGSLGPNAFDIINGSNIKAYKCANLSMDEVIEKYNNKELEEINSCGASHQG